MSGYTGNPDAEAEHALILAENGIYAAQQELSGRVLTHCLECGEEIDPKRIQFCVDKNMKCEYCIICQAIIEKQPKAKVRMLDWIL